jgi:homopolymeric O-antigen transport system permease protein
MLESAATNSERHLGTEESVKVPGAATAPSERDSTGAEETGQLRPTPHVLIRPRKGWGAIDFREFWEFRDLLWILALRDIQIRYKQTALGILWALIQPIATVAIFTIVVGRAMGVESLLPVVDGERIPYPVYAFIGQVGWLFFSNSVNAASLSLVTNAPILRKIYFPRLIMPIAAMGAPVLDFAISFVLFFFLMVAYGVSMGWGVLLVPVLALGMVVPALGVGLLMSSLSVAYRDFKYVVPFMITLWFWVTPVVFPPQIFPEHLKWLLYLNPMYGSVEGFRSAVLGIPWNLTGLATSTATGVVIFVVSLVYFTRVERQFADIV